MALFTVVATMAEPVVYFGDGLHLDGILSFAAFMDMDPELRAELPSITSDWAVDFDLPLAKWKVPASVQHVRHDRLIDGESVWGWKASAVHAVWQCRDRHALRKKPELAEMARYTTSPSVNTGTGQQKAANIEYPSLFAQELHWYAEGDQAKTARLLKQHVRSVGKLANQGSGRVRDWRIAPVAFDASVEYEGVLRRVMPATYSTTAVCSPSEATLRPPYHHNSRYGLALRPLFERLLPVESSHADR